MLRTARLAPKAAHMLNRVPAQTIHNQFNSPCTLAISPIYNGCSNWKECMKWKHNGARRIDMEGRQAMVVNRVVVLMG